MDHPDLPFGEQLPHMVVEPPGPASRALGERLARVEVPAASSMSVGDVPVFWARARGANVEDADGNRYVDVTGAFFVCAAGHSNPRIVDAICDQSRTLMHSQGCVNPNLPRVELAETLARITPGDLGASYIANTGGEAVDMALKTARLHTGRHTVVAFQGGFHGKTLASLSVTSKAYFRAPSQGQLGGSVHIPYASCYRCAFGRTYPECGMACATYLDHVLGSPSSGVGDVAAVIVEPVQGLGGVIVPPPEFVPMVADTCRKHGVLLIADEIITGFGRTGTLFGVDHAGVEPDIMVLGKGLASGFPVSAMVTTKAIASCWGPEQHTSTFLGHPVGCAAAVAGIAEVIDRDLPARSATLGARLLSQLLDLQARHPIIGNVRGHGLLAALELVTDRATRAPATAAAKRVIAEALTRGLMATLRGGEWGHCIRMAPSLTITDDQLDFAVRTLDACLTLVEAEG